MKNMIFILSLLLALDMALASSLLKVSGEMELHVLDVGQGDAVLIVTPDGHKVLVDGGPGSAVLSELGEVMPYLFGEIDLMILSHPHMDHIEGLIFVLDRFEVGAVLMSAPKYGSNINEAFLERMEGRQVYFADDDTDFRLGSVSLDVLYPFEPFTGKEMENVNNASPVIMVEGGGKRILLTGDAELEAEAEILEAGVDLDADILKAGHHGSRTSSSRDFLEAVSPALMLISCGEDNSYLHPHPETLQKAEEMGIEVRRTDLDGRIDISL